MQVAEGPQLFACLLLPSSLQKPTTGLLAITLALHFCDLVHIAGFGYPDSSNKKQTIHYYEQITLKSMAVSIYPHFLSTLPPIFPLGWGTAAQESSALLPPMMLGGVGGCPHGHTSLPFHNGC